MPIKDLKTLLQGRGCDSELARNTGAGRTQQEEALTTHEANRGKGEKFLGAKDIDMQLGGSASSLQSMVTWS